MRTGAERPTGAGSRPEIDPETEGEPGVHRLIADGLRALAAADHHVEVGVDAHRELEKGTDPHHVPEEVEDGAGELPLEAREGERHVHCIEAQLLPATAEAEERGPPVV